MFLFCRKSVRTTHMPNTPTPDVLLSPGLCSETRLETGSRHGRPGPVTGEQPDQGAACSILGGSLLQGKGSRYGKTTTGCWLSVSSHRLMRK